MSESGAMSYEILNSFVVLTHRRLYIDTAITCNPISLFFDSGSGCVCYVT